ncbi:diacylglycerol/polyprenol kinase family protein [Candidatus Oscillochloris fontis]|uniref:diacylglycerol/polyprenol kinase family protein n=1 Tax=Candidatus Oscillochloris fontis TaxID=2496868 RepID=UPI00101E0212|nr:phosphatidate cytidylyltransferase [Candidatus Oscillochloris fontis]
MTTRDVIGLISTFGYATSLIVIAEIIRRRKGYPQDFTRKFVHIGAGMSVFLVLALFDTWYVGIFPFVVFIFLNYIFWRYKILDAVDASDSTPGTVYFAFSISLVFGLLWRPDDPTDLGYLALAATMAMTWGDALAAIIGKRIGKHRYTVIGGTRSYEGSLVMFLVSCTAMFLSLLLIPGSFLSPTAQPLGFGLSLLASLVTALVVTLAEGISPHGMDNISVPILAALSLYTTVMLLG